MSALPLAVAGPATGRTATAFDDRSVAPVVALIGRPNVGKSTFLGRANGSFVETANAPGTTVLAERRWLPRTPGAASPGRADRVWRRTPKDPHRRGDGIWLVDLPGTSSLVDTPVGEAPFWRDLVAAQPDAILVVVDAGNLARHLPLVLACRDLGLPVVVAANLADEARARGVDIDSGRLSQLLAAPVHVTVGRTGSGVAAAVSDAARLARQRRRVLDGASPQATSPASVYPMGLELELAAGSREIFAEAATEAPRSLGAAVLSDGIPGLVTKGAISARGAASLRLADRLEAARWQLGAAWAAQVELHVAGDGPSITNAERATRLATRPWPGLPLFVAVTLAAFGTMLLVGGWLSAVLGSAWSSLVSPALSATVHMAVPQPALAATVLWALDGGLFGLVSIGVPYVLTFYVLLAALEDSGYLTSAAVLTDRLFNAFGLPGRAAIPLLAAAGCNVPAIYGTRVLATRRERLLASFLITMTPCSARSAVVIAAVAPFAGPAAALAAFGVVAGLTIVGAVLANRMVPGRQPALVLELAPLRRPIPSQVIGKAWSRFRDFIRQAAPVMLAGSLVLGALYETGAVWGLTGVLDPIVHGWLGLPAVAGLALVFAFLRKELALQLLVALAVVQLGAGAQSLGAFMSPGQLFVYAIVTSVSVPCVATLAALGGEFGWRAAGTMSAATLGIALVSGGLLARLIGIA